jgi:multidrug efflux pump subunit AcrA (membrane-fusion protein)
LVNAASPENAPAGGQPKKKTPLVRVVLAAKGSISKMLELTGELVAVESAVIAAMTEGPVVFCPWREGDLVKKGEKLIEIDRSVLRAEVQVAQAAAAVARARLKDMQTGTRPEEIAKAQETVKQLRASASFAQMNLERAAKLTEKGTLSAEHLEKARMEAVSEAARLATAEKHLEMLKNGPTPSALAVQQTLVKETEARLALAEAKFAEGIIFAPFDGVVIKAHVRPGSLAATKTPLIEMTDFSSIVLRFAVPEALAAVIQQGMSLELTLDAYADQKLEGKVVRVYPDLDRQLRTRAAEAEVSGGGKLLLPGMFGRLHLRVKTVHDTVVLPLGALFDNPAGGQAVFVIEEGRAARRTVQTGIEERGRIQIVAGVSPGDTVVTAGGEKLKDGAEVLAANEDAGGKKAGHQPDKAGRAEL